MLERVAIVLVVLSSLAGEAEAWPEVPKPIIRAWKKGSGAVSRTWKHATLELGARTRMGFDSDQANLERLGFERTAHLLGDTRRFARPFSPLAMAEFLGARIKAEPGILKGYAALKIASEVGQVGALAFLPVGLGAGIAAASGLPLTIAYYVAAEHFIRRRDAPPGQKPHLLTTMRALRDDYGSFRDARDRQIDAEAERLRAEEGLVRSATP